VGLKAFPYGESFRENGAKNCIPLSNTSHTRHMHKARVSYWIHAVLALCATVVWAGIIWVALQVSTIVLKTLEQIVDLAAIT